MANLQAICRHCHAIKTAYEKAAPASAALPDWLPTSLIPVEVVCGPPGAGKTTYVRERAKANELVIDVDQIASEISGKPMYQASTDERYTAVHVRNSLLSALAKPGMRYRKVWLITTAGSDVAREFWRGKYGNLTVIPHDKAECARRVQLDSRRNAESKAEALNVIANWN